MDGLRRAFFFGLLAVGVACSDGSQAKVDGSATPGSGGVGSLADSGAGGSGGLGGTHTLGPGDSGLGGAFGSGGAIGSSGGSAGPASGGGMVSSGGHSGGVSGSGGQAGGNAVDAADGGVSGSGGQSADSGGGGGLAIEAGAALDVPRSETFPPFPTCGASQGTLGGAATAESSMQRYAVTGTDCRKYIVQNNNFANPTGSLQSLTFSGTTFEVVGSTASSAIGATSPASFPSVYIGANGSIAKGAYSTWSDSDLPRRVNAIMRVLTTFNVSGGASAGDFAATVDAWFAKAKPTEGAYDDAISGSLMIWLGKPSNRQPVGARVREATIAGRSWEVWVGPHGATALGTDDPNRPVVSYVNQNGTLSKLEFDLVNFIADAVANGSGDMSAGHTSQQFSSQWYLTDVMAGFQIWTGSDATGLKCTNFACQVK